MSSSILINTGFFLSVCVCVCAFYFQVCVINEFENVYHAFSKLYINVFNDVCAHIRDAHLLLSLLMSPSHEESLLSVFQYSMPTLNESCSIQYSFQAVFLVEHL